MCTNMQPEWKCAQRCSLNGNFHKYAARIEIFTNMQPELKKDEFIYIKVQIMIFLIFLKFFEMFQKF